VSHISRGRESRLQCRRAHLGKNHQVIRSHNYSSVLGLDMLDSICMMLIAVGENFKSIDKQTDGKLLEQYSEVNWKGVKGVRDVISHQYFNIDAEEIYYICSHDLENLRTTVDSMINDLEKPR